MAQGVLRRADPTLSLAMEEGRHQRNQSPGHWGYSQPKGKDWVSGWNSREKQGLPTTTSEWWTGGESRDIQMNNKIHLNKHLLCVGYYARKGEPTRKRLFPEGTSILQEGVMLEKVIPALGGSRKSP